MAKDFEHIDNPYDSFLQRGEPDAGNGSVETMPVKSDGSMGDVWINNFLKSTNWNPRSVGFYIDGQTGYAEFTNIYASGSITATSGTVGGWTISASELSRGNVKLQSTAERILLGSATAPLTGTGIFIGLDGADYELRAGDPAGAYMHWDGTNLNVVGSAITSSSIASIPNSTATDISLLGWTHDITFSASDLDTVAWTTGTITLSTGRTFAIAPAANTGNMAARTYIYLDTAVSSTALQTTTTASTAIGANKILIAVAVNSTDKAEFQVFGGTGNKNVLVDNIAANSTSTNEFVSNTAQIKDLIVTNAKINDLAVSKLTAGTITSKAITLAISAGVGDTYIAAGKTDFDNTVAGFILGLDDSDSDRAKFYIGDSSIYLNWTGVALDVVGGTITAGTIQTASTNPAIRMSSTGGFYQITATNSDAHDVLDIDTGDAGLGYIMQISVQDEANRAIEIIVAASFTSGVEANANPITISNAADSISINITDGGLIGLQIAGCDTSAINVTVAPTNGPGIDLTYSSGDYPVIDIEQGGTATNSYGIRIAQSANAAHSAIFVNDDSTGTGTSPSVYIDRDLNTASNDYHALQVDCANAGSGEGNGIEINAKSSAITISSAATGIDFVNYGGTYIFALPADGTALGAYAGRIPVNIAGVGGRFIPYYN